MLKLIILLVGFVIAPRVLPDTSFGLITEDDISYGDHSMWRQDGQGTLDEKCQFTVEYEQFNVPRIHLKPFLWEKEKYKSCVTGTVKGQELETPKAMDRGHKFSYYVLDEHVMLTWQWSYLHLVLLICIIAALILFALFNIVSFKLGQHARPMRPHYWSFSNQLQVFNDDFYNELDITDRFKSTIQDLLDKTTESESIGTGRDDCGMTHTRLKVTKVYRIENGKVWSRYARYRASVAPLKEARHSELARETLKVLEETHSGQKLLSSLNLDEKRGETLLFHGAPSGGAVYDGHRLSEQCSSVHIIKKQGFDERLGCLEGMFGSGIYFADKSSKADTYAGRYSNEKSSVGEKAMIFLARTTLGDPYVTTKSLPKLRRPPCVEEHFDPKLLWDPDCEIGEVPWKNKFEAKCFARCEHALHGSVISDFIINGEFKNYREFVVYHGDCAYPEFLIEYVRE